MAGQQMQSPPPPPHKTEFKHRPGEGAFHGRAGFPKTERGVRPPKQPEETLIA